MNLSHAIGWTLVHSLWEIVVVALILLLVGLFLPRSNARLRYGLALSSLVLSLVGPVATYFVLTPAAPAVLQSTLIGNASVANASSIREVRAPSIETPRNEPLKMTLRERIDDALPKAVIFWLIGMAVMCVRLIGGLASIQRLKNRSSEVSDPQWLAVITRVSGRLNVKGAIVLKVSDRIETPIVIGLLKSVVIFPASALIKLSPSDVEALMAHELAHIRRYDYLVNLCQSVVETALFYHPAIWWISSVVRAERENCCDDLAISALGNREQYAKALLGLEQMRHPVPQLALAANRGSLVSRVRRIVLPSPRPVASSSGWLAALVIVAVAIGLSQRLHANPQHGNRIAARKFPLKGRVLDSQGHPVAGATVYYTFKNFGTGESQEAQVVSDSHGFYSTATKMSDTYVAVAYRKDLGVGTERFDQKLGRVSRLHKIENATVKIVDTNGIPVTGVRVGPSLYFDGLGGSNLPTIFHQRFAGTTNASGIARVGGVMVDGYTGFEVDDDRFAEQHQIFKKSNDGSPLRIMLLPACRVGGTVTLEGKAVPGALILARTKYGLVGQSHTDQSGNFEVKRLTKEKYTVTCRLPEPLKADWTTHSLTVDTSPNQMPFCEFRLEKGALLQGKVVDHAGKPSPKVMVSIALAGEDAYSVYVGPISSDGTFQVRVPAGTHNINQFSQWQTSNTSVTVRDGETKQITLTTPAKEDAVDITCKVLDANGKQMEGFLLDYGFTDSTGKPQVLQAQTGLDGKTLLHPLKSQVNSLWVRAGSDTQDSGAVKIGQARELTVRMHPITPDTVFGKVVDTSGKPLKGVDVCIMRFFAPGRAMSTGSQTTNSRGEYAFTHVYKEATYIVMAQGHGVADSFTPNYVLNPNGQRIQARPIVMPPGHAIRGRIVDQLGKPVRNASVLASNSSMPFGSQASTEKDGTFAIYRLAVGRYTLTISRDGKKATASASTDSSGDYKLNL